MEGFPDEIGPASRTREAIHIKNGAVSRRGTNGPKSGTVNANINVPGLKVLDTLTITVPSSVAVNLQLAWSYLIQVSKTGATITGSIRVRRGSVVVDDIAMSVLQAAGAATAGSNFRHVIDFPPTGTISYVVEHLASVQGQAGGAGSLQSKCTLKASWNLV